MYILSHMSVHIMRLIKMYNYLIGAMFMFGFCMATPVWENMSWDEKTTIVIVWPVALGALVYTELNKDE